VGVDEMLDTATGFAGSFSDIARDGRVVHDYTRIGIVQLTGDFV